MTKPFNIKSAAFVAILTLTASVNVNAQPVNCPPITSDITVSASCNTGIDLTGNNNLTIGTPTSGSVVVTDDFASAKVINVTGTGNTINNTSSGTISAGDNQGIYNDGGTITTLINAGTITASGEGGEAIYNSVTDDGIGNITPGTITTLTNTGTITVGDEDANGIQNNDSIITTLTNTGTITAGDVEGVGIWNRGNGSLITTLNNSGTITVGNEDGIGIRNRGTITTLNNSGTITVGDENGRGISNERTITTLTNTGTITVGDDGYGISMSGGPSSSITTLTNTGTISAGLNGNGIRNNQGTITTLINSGTITAGSDAIYNTNDGIITTLTNTGTILAGAGGFGIYNNSEPIGTLNNAQGAGNGAGALTYNFALPTNYNIIIRSPTEYGQLAVTSPSGSTTFGIFAGSTVRNGTYAAVLTGVTSTNLVTRSGTFGTGTWELINSSGNIWDLFLAGIFSGPSTADTQQSLVNSASALQSTYALQNAVLANSFSYDCSVFGANNVCVSAGGRNTALSAANGLNNTSALLIAAYRIKPTLRIGAYADQNLSVNNAGSTVNLGNNTPLIGLFGVWNERLDGTGTEVKVSAAYGQKNTTVNRQVVGTSEAGSGSSNLNSQGAQITAKYGFAVLPEVLVSPYVGLRYTQNNMGGYTEGTSATVTAPLTYSALNTNATTALAGVTAAYRFIPKATAFASAGVETDTNTSGGTYSASGVTGLTPVNFNPNPVKTRPTATLGAYYDIVKNQRIGITGIYRQESYQAISTTTVMATYTIGL